MYPEAARRIRARVASHQRQRGTALSQMQEAAKEIEKTADAATTPDEPARGGRDQVQRVQVVQPGFRASDYLWIGGVGLVGFLGQFSVILFLVYFLLVTGDLYKRKLVKIAGPTLAKKRVTVQILDDEINEQNRELHQSPVHHQPHRRLRDGRRLVGVRPPELRDVGSARGPLQFDPYLGPMLVTGGLGLVAFMQFDDLAKSMYISGAAFAITTLEGMVLTPMMMGRAARMNPVAIFVGLLFWTWVWGVWGTVLAVPMLMMMKAISDHVEDLHPIGELLGE